MSANEHPMQHAKIGHECGEFPELKRLKYFYGQLLGAHDFQIEQNYFREKLKLHNRCLHGYGTVCGLKVAPEPAEKSCESEEEAERRKLEEYCERLNQEKAEALKQADAQQKVEDLDRELEALRRALEKHPPHCHEKESVAKVRIECGLALDCEGNELILRRSLTVDLWDYLEPAERKKIIDHGAATLYLSLCYCELPMEPMRPVVPDACGAASGCMPGKLLDAVRVRVTTQCPEPDTRCQTCCEPCADPCLLLARIDCFKPGESPKAEHIHNEVRRLVEGPYRHATITGVNWVHGGAYNQDDAATILGSRDGSSHGLKVRFSRPVLVSSLTRGVVDVWVIQGGQTRSSDIYSLEGEFVDLPAGKTTTEFRYRYMGDEKLDHGDRVLVIIRTAFILDECCRPVDGAHVGGRVALIHDHDPYDQSSPYHEPISFADCPMPPPAYGPWTSGTGHPGANFESWFYVIKAAYKSGQPPRAKEQQT